MLRIVDTILVLIGDVAPIAEQIGRHDPSLARQLRDALSSVALNTSEGSAQRGARRTNHYAIALGSARESFTALRVANASMPSSVPSSRTSGERLRGVLARHATMDDGGRDRLMSSGSHASESREHESCDRDRAKLSGSRASESRGHESG
jgi:four helix bundle protein